MADKNTIEEHDVLHKLWVKAGHPACRGLELLDGGLVLGFDCWNSAGRATHVEAIQYSDNGEYTGRVSLKKIKPDFVEPTTGHLMMQVAEEEWGATLCAVCNEEGCWMLVGPMGVDVEGLRPVSTGSSRIELALNIIIEANEKKKANTQ
jgi:hypothetical protein